MKAKTLKNTLLYRVVNLVTLLSFVVSMTVGDPLWAAKTTPDLAKDLSPAALNVSEISVPMRYGEIKDSHQGTNGKTIIHIQDAHCNYPAQQSIKSIMEYLTASNPDINLVSLEGGKGDYDLSVFTRIADPDIRSRVSDAFVKEGVVSGPEFYAINNPDRVKLFGIEDDKLYFADLDAYRAFLPNKNEADKYLNTIAVALSNLKSKSYNPELKELDTRTQSYKDGKTNFKDYMLFLKDKASRSGVDMKSYKNTDGLLAILKEEKAIDFKKAEKERSVLIDKLKAKLSKKDLEELVLKSVQLKSGDVSSDDYYGYLFRKAQFGSVDFSTLPNLVKYSEYVKHYESLDKSAIFREAKDLERAIVNALAKTDDQRTLYELDNDLAIIRGMFNIALTKDNYDYYIKNKDKFSSKRFTDFVNTKAPMYKLDFKLNSGIEKLEAYREDLEKFYSYSLKRDEAFVKNIGDKLKAENRSGTILVTGGFHTENLARIFKEMGYSYIGIMPKFAKMEWGCPYFKLLSGGRSDIEKGIDASVSGIAIASMLSELGIVGSRDKDLFGLSVEVMRMLENNPTDGPILLMRGGNIKITTEADKGVDLKFGKEIFVMYINGVPTKVYAVRVGNEMFNPYQNGAIAVDAGAGITWHTFDIDTLWRMAHDNSYSGLEAHSLSYVLKNHNVLRDRIASLIGEENLIELLRIADKRFNDSTRLIHIITGANGSTLPWRVGSYSYPYGVNLALFQNANSDLDVDRVILALLHELETLADPAKGDSEKIFQTQFDVPTPDMSAVTPDSVKELIAGIDQNLKGIIDTNAADSLTIGMPSTSAQDSWKQVHDEVRRSTEALENIDKNRMTRQQSMLRAKIRAEFPAEAVEVETIFTDRPTENMSAEALVELKESVIKKYMADDPDVIADPRIIRSSYPMVIVREKGGEVLGFATYRENDKDYELMFHYVYKADRGRNAGRYIISALLGHLKSESQVSGKYRFTSTELTPDGERVWSTIFGDRVIWNKTVPNPSARYSEPGEVLSLYDMTHPTETQRIVDIYLRSISLPEAKPVYTRQPKLIEGLNEPTKRCDGWGELADLIMNVSQAGYSPDALDSRDFDILQWFFHSLCKGSNDPAFIKAMADRVRSIRADIPVSGRPAGYNFTSDFFMADASTLKKIISESVPADKLTAAMPATPRAMQLDEFRDTIADNITRRLKEKGIDLLDFQRYFGRQVLSAGLTPDANDKLIGGIVRGEFDLLRRKYPGTKWYTGDKADERERDHYIEVLCSAVESRLKVAWRERIIDGRNVPAWVTVLNNVELMSRLSDIASRIKTLKERAALTPSLYPQEMVDDNMKTLRDELKPLLQEAINRMNDYDKKLADYFKGVAPEDMQHAIGVSSADRRAIYERAQNFLDVISKFKDYVDDKAVLIRLQIRTLESDLNLEIAMEKGIRNQLRKVSRDKLLPANKARQENLRNEIGRLKTELALMQPRDKLTAGMPVVSASAIESYPVMLNLADRMRKIAMIPLSPAYDREKQFELLQILENIQSADPALAANGVEALLAEKTKGVDGNVFIPAIFEAVESDARMSDEVFVKYLEATRDQLRAISNNKLSASTQKADLSPTVPAIYSHPMMIDILYEMEAIADKEPKMMAGILKDDIYGISGVISKIRSAKTSEFAEGLNEMIIGTEGGENANKLIAEAVDNVARIKGMTKEELIAQLKSVRNQLFTATIEALSISTITIEGKQVTQATFDNRALGILRRSNIDSLLDNLETYGRDMLSKMYPDLADGKPAAVAIGLTKEQWEKAKGKLFGDKAAAGNLVVKHKISKNFDVIFFLDDGRTTDGREIADAIKQYDRRVAVFAYVDTKDGRVTPASAERIKPLEELSYQVVNMNAMPATDEVATATPIGACFTTGLALLRHQDLLSGRMAVSDPQKRDSANDILLGLAAMSGGMVNRDKMDDLMKKIEEQGYSLEGILFLVNLRPIDIGEIADFHEREAEVLRSL